MRPHAGHPLASSPPYAPKHTHTHTHTVTATSHKVKSFSRVQRPSKTPQIYMNLQQPTNDEEKDDFSAAICAFRVHVCIHAWPCVSMHAHVLITRRLHWHICPVSLSLLIAILNLAVWCAPATSDLCAAAVRHDTH